MHGTVKYAEYNNLDTEIKRAMKRSASDVVLLGYLLGRMMEEKLWAEMYGDLDSYLREELHMDYTMASRFVRINQKYSADGGREIDEKWADYSQSVLIEMLNMAPELMEKVTPDMTARQVREMKRQARKEAASIMADAVSLKVSEGQLLTEEAQRNLDAGVFPEKEEALDAEYQELAPGEKVATSQLQEEMEGQLPGQMRVEDYPELLPESRYEEITGEPDGDLDTEWRESEPVPEVATSQCPGLTKPDKKQAQYLDDFARKFISFKQDWMLADFGNRVMDVCKSPDEIKRHLGKENRTWFFSSGRDEAAHINLFDDCVQLWDGMNTYMGSFEWFYLAAAIQSMWNVVALEKCGAAQEAPGDEGRIEGRDAPLDDPDSENGEKPAQFDEYAETRRILANEKKLLDEYLAVEGLPEKLMFKQKTMVAALEALAWNLENAEDEPEPEEKKQPELPVFRNNAQRKEWLKAYKDWGLWYRDDNIGVEYYKYDFDNGARLIAEVYQEPATKYTSAYESCFLHLVGGPEPPKGQYGVGKWARRNRYCKHPNCDTELVEFLKEVQKNG